MTEKLNTAKTLITNNARWIIVIIAGIIALWLNSKYMTRSEGELLRAEVDALKTEILLMKQRNELKVLDIEKDQNAIEARLEKKIKILNKYGEEIDNNENEILKLKQKH